MSGSLELRKFLMRHEEAESIATGSAVPSQRTANPDGLRVSEDQARRAQRAIAGRARDAEDCALLLDMLGLSGGADGRPSAQR